METINQRIQIIVNTYFGGNVSKFCRDTGIRQSTISDIIGKAGTQPSVATVAKILNGETIKINADWLIMGKGEMTTREMVEEMPGVANPKEIEIELRIALKNNKELQDQVRRLTEEYAVARYRLDQKLGSLE